MRPVLIIQYDINVFPCKWNPLKEWHVSNKPFLVEIYI